MKFLRSFIELCVDIVNSSIWIATTFWIALGICLVTWIFKAWNVAQEAGGRIEKAFLFALWGLLIVEMLFVIIMSL